MNLILIHTRVCLFKTPVTYRGEQKFRVLSPCMCPKKGTRLHLVPILGRILSDLVPGGTQFDWFRICVPDGSGSEYPILRIGFLSYLNSEVLNWKNGDEFYLIA